MHDGNNNNNNDDLLHGYAEWSCMTCMWDHRLDAVAQWFFHNLVNNGKINVNSNF